MFVIHEITKQKANDVVAQWHRHNKPISERFITFCLGLYEYIIHPVKTKRLLGVIVVGEPSGRPNCLKTFEIRRVCFAPGVKFSDLRRWYEHGNHKYDKNPKLSMRLKPVLLQDFGPFAGNAVKTHEIPSFFVQVVEGYIADKTKMPGHRIKNCVRLWTYIRKDESGKYLVKAGYTPDKIFKHHQGDGVTRVRYTKYLQEPAQKDLFNLAA